MMKTKKTLIGKNEIGENNPCFIIAEAGVNHNGKLELAKRLVDVAVEACADAVKFQTFKAEDVVSQHASLAEYQKKNVGVKESQLDMLKKLELQYKDFIELKSYCDKKKMIFLSTPHTEDAVDFLEDLVPAYKIGSGDLTNLPLLEKIAQKEKPIIISTGMGALEEIKEAVDTIERYNEQLVLMHCTTSYPCPENNVNLLAITTLKEEFGYPVGYSDHTLGINVALMAASLGAVMVEKHFTLDKRMEGPDHRMSLSPEELTEMIKAIRSKKKIEIPEEILGTGVVSPTRKELEIAKVARKSVIANQDIPRNTIIMENMLIIKRPGTGIPPKELQRIIGRKARLDIKKDELLSWEKIE